MKTSMTIKASSLPQMFLEIRRRIAVYLAVALSAFCLGQSAQAATETFTYSGQPFSYNGSAYSSVTRISGFFTVASPLAANSTYTNSGLSLWKVGDGAGPAIVN